MSTAVGQLLREIRAIRSPRVSPRASWSRSAAAVLKGDDLGRRIQGRPATLADQLAQERPLLRALPDAGAFDSTEVASARVDSKALVTVRQSRYSVPVTLVGLRVAAAIGATEIRISHQANRRAA